MVSLKLFATPLKDAEVNEIREGKFFIHCPKVCLKQSNSDELKEYNGPGFISQDETKNLIFTLYPKEEFSLFDFIDEINNPKALPGELIPTTEYFTFVASDIESRTWTSDGIYLRPGNRTVIGGKLDRIKCEQTIGDEPDSEKKGTLILRIFTKVRLPFNTGTAQITEVEGQSSHSFSLNILKCVSDEIDFRIQDEEHTLTIYAEYSVKQFHEMLEKRIVETLWFLTSKLMYPSIVNIWNNQTRSVTVYSKKRDMSLITRLVPPVSNRFDHHKTFCTLFDKYFSFVNEFQDKSFHPISSQIRAIIRASAGSMDTEILVLSIAVEMLVNLIVPNQDLTPEEDAWLNSLKSSLKEGPQPISDRASAILTMLKTTGASQRLKQLIESDVITNEQRSAWSKLRNRAAHGMAIDTEDFQTTLNNYHKVLVLFYQLVFHRIGYEGDYVDYSLRGFPIRFYPSRKGA